MFSIVIPVYGASPFLQDCLRGLADQSVAAREIIVFHTGPHDPTESILAKFPSVRIFHEDPRQFAGGARNRGATQAQGEWLAFLDCDMVADPDWLRHLNAAAERDPGDVLIGSVGRRGGGIWGMVMWFAEFGSVFPHRTSQIMSSGPSANFVVRRELFLRSGGFRPDLVAAEDGDLFSRFKAMGCKLRLVPDARADHSFEGGAARSLRRLFDLGRAASFLRRRHSLLGSSAVRHPPFALLLPFARLGQMALRLIFERGPFLLFVGLLPLIFTGLVSWSIGFYQETRRPTYPMK